MAAIQEAKAKNLALELMRDGKPVKVSVKPARSAAGVTEYRPKPGQPGAIVAPKGYLALPEPPLPDNMTVTITKTGKHPAVITVKEGDKKWEISGKEFAKLPKEVRPYVEALLGRPVLTYDLRGLGGVGAGPMPGAPLVPPRVWHRMTVPPPAPGVEKRLQEMNERIEQLEKAIQELKAKPRRRRGG